jgi:hypothetical protein
MSSSGSVGGSTHGKRRSQSEPKGWKSIPNSVKILVLVCILVVVLIPLTRRRASTDGGVGAIKPAPSTTGALDNIKAAPGLSLHELKLDPATRTLKGSVANPTDTNYSSVQVSFNIFGKDGSVVGIIEANIPEVPAKNTAPFETTRLPPDGKEYDLREVVGSPHK